MKKFEIPLKDFQKLDKLQMKNVLGGTELLCPCGIATQCDIGGTEHQSAVGLAESTTITSCHGTSNEELQSMCDAVFFGSDTDGSCFCLSCGDS